MAKTRSKTRSKSKRRSNIVREIHTIRNSRIGFSPSIPKVIRNGNDIKNVGQNMQKIKKMLVAITATWCGACHSISDRLNTAISRSNNGTRIDEKMLGKFNNDLKTSIEPPHFPYFIVINENAKIVKVLKDMDEVENFLSPEQSESMASLRNSNTMNNKNNGNNGNNGNNRNNGNNGNNE